MKARGTAPVRQNETEEVIVKSIAPSTRKVRSCDAREIRVQGPRGNLLACGGRNFDCASSCPRLLGVVPLTVEQVVGEQVNPSATLSSGSGNQRDWGGIPWPKTFRDLVSGEASRSTAGVHTPVEPNHVRDLAVRTGPEKCSGPVLNPLPDTFRHPFRGAGPDGPPAAPRSPQ